MIDFGYLYRGLCGLRKLIEPARWPVTWAAVIAGYFFGEDRSDLVEEVDRGVEGELNRILHGEETVWFNAPKAGITIGQLFEPMPAEPPEPKRIDGIAVALDKNIGQTRESGHNVIFAAIAIRAVRDHPDYATPAIVSGVCKLIEGFHAAHPGRGYYGKEKGWLYGHQVTLLTDDRFPPYRSEQDMADAVIDELIANGSVRRQGFGGLWHLINHAAALTELSRYGYKELAQKGLPAHHHHMRLWRSLPDVESELGPMKRAEHDPLDPRYWSDMLKRDEARLTHRIKTLYGYYLVRRFVRDEDRRQKADDSLRYLMA